MTCWWPCCDTSPSVPGCPSVCNVPYRLYFTITQKQDFPSAGDCSTCIYPVGTVWTLDYDPSFTRTGHLHTTTVIWAGEVGGSWLSVDCRLNFSGAFWLYMDMAWCGDGSAVRNTAVSNGSEACSPFITPEVHFNSTFSNCRVYGVLSE